MKSYTKEEIKIFIDLVYKDEYPKPDEVSVDLGKDVVSITFTSEYHAPALNFAILKKLSVFFETDNINDDDRFQQGGCTTCDYGSAYGFTLQIRADTAPEGK